MKSAVKYKCVCGYISDGDEAPAVCPKCGAPAAKFTRLDDAAANLVERSRRTNMLHCRVIALAREIEGLCKEGIADELDPGCVDVFRK
nr:rubredoxin [Phycisphaerae bacterium]